VKIVDSILAWLDERTGLRAPLVKAATHPVPAKSQWYYVFGTAIMTSFFVQLITGVALATLYVPSAGEAHQTVFYISNQAPFGRVLRGMHYFGASSMIIFTFVHMARVYLFGSYKFPRELNWLTGVVLLFFTLAMGFTGQVLRWDQTSIWTMAVGAQQAVRMPVVGKLLAQIMFSGDTVGSATLSHFFALHVFIFPGLLIGLIGLHVWLVLHNGISEPPVSGEPVDPKTYKQKYNDMLKREGRPFWPDAAWRDIVVSTVVVIVIYLLALFIGPPAIEKPPDPSLIKAQPKPDWYLLWYFALLALSPHKAEDWIIILFPLFLVTALLALPFISNKGERSLKKRPWAVAIVVLVLAATTALTVEGFREPWTPNFAAKPLTVSEIGVASGAVYDGAQVFNNKGCIFCHSISGHGGQRGPDLTDAGDRLTNEQLVIRIMGGGYNMPSYSGNLTPQQLKDLTTFLESRKKN
jgi:ubiquinol-cytochrome c reductase cytochrome b subunit